MTRSSARRIGVISGTGVTEHFEVLDRKTVRTEYGPAVVYPARNGSYFVLPRHGMDHGIPPHMVNYRANIASLRKLGVREVISTTAVGSMNRRFRVGQLGLVDQFIDFTSRRGGTFFDTSVRHVDVTSPYSRRLNGALLRAAARTDIKLRSGLVYVCVEGPRFETAAEIRMFQMLGGDIVGMTGVPEVVLAREAGLEYSSIAAATNWAAGIQEKVSHEEVLGEMKRIGPKVKSLIVAAIRLLEGEG
ncbi:MAG TPA: MTAP family purine nucleoside phosphorylase [Nitrososphaerales archaeon]|nr:MTAP family purine nucleoside phosphorylase [Nitrososphaerales archaeon]